MFVKERFVLNDRTKGMLRDMEPPFGYNGFGEFIFYRTYSRIRKSDGGQEDWYDVVVRSTEGTFSIRKDWYLKNYIDWNEDFWQHFAHDFAINMFMMKWTPPGRGLWAVGTDFVYERGSMACNNCGYTHIENAKFGEDIQWLMEALMHGVGVGFHAMREGSLEIYNPIGSYDFEIPDTREGWTESEKLLIHTYTKPNQKKPRFIYDKIRKKGLPIKGFGGISSGPEELMKLHRKTEEQFEIYNTRSEYDEVYLKTNIANLVGCCVVSGNVRRSAELAKGSIDDDIFLDLKNYDRFPERAEFGWMSNNSVELAKDEDFDKLSEIAKRVVRNGEPGYMNRINMKRGRIGKNDGLREDAATGFNPCILGDSKLLTPQGIRKLYDIKINDYIWCEYGWTRVVNKWTSGIKKVYKYQTTAGSFTGTDNHEIVCDGYKTPVGESYGIDILSGPKEQINIEIIPSIVMDGLVIGDGMEHNGVILLCIGENDKDIFTSEVALYIKQNFGDIYSYKILTNIKTLPRTFNREIPDKYFYGDKNTICSFLRGLYSANGCVYQDRIILTSTSFKIIEQVQMMLSTIGIRSFYNMTKEYDIIRSGKTYRCKNCHNLNIKVDRARFFEYIGFIQKYKNDKLKEICKKSGNGTSKKTYDIISIEYLGEEEVFDITVEKDCHTFWCGGLNVANCGEIPLENRELCNISETFPTVCENSDEWLDACKYAAFYCSTISLLPTQSPETNRVIARNRRIGISIVDVSGWKLNTGTNKLIKYLRKGYKQVREINNWANDEAGIPRSIRVTCIKPGGTTPKLPGKTPGFGFPTFWYTLRRTRVPKNSPINDVLIKHSVPYEEDIFSANTNIFEWPILQGPAKPAEQASLWEQAMMLVLMQREWADNACSNTLYFKPRWAFTFKIKGMEALEEFIGTVEARQILYNRMEEYIVPRSYRFEIMFDGPDISTVKVYEYDPNHEEYDVEPVLSAIAPLTKSVALLPHCLKGVYPQMPEEGISESEYHRRLKEMKKIDWSLLKGSDGMDEKYCQGPSCEIPGVK